MRRTEFTTSLNVVSGLNQYRFPRWYCSCVLYSGLVHTHNTMTMVMTIPWVHNSLGLEHGYVFTLSVLFTTWMTYLTNQFRHNFNLFIGPAIKVYIRTFDCCATKAESESQINWYKLVFENSEEGGGVLKRSHFVQTRYRIADTR